MLTNTDYIIIALLLFFAYRGAKKGLVKTLLGPVSLIIASVISYIYYRETGNLKYSLLIAILGPFVFNITISILMYLFGKLIKNKKTISPVSQVLGALLNVLWSAILLLLTISLFVLVPINNPVLLKIQNNILDSQTFALLNTLTGNYLSASKNNIQTFANTFSDPKKLKTLQSSKEFKTLYNNKKFQAILQDKDLVEKLRRKDIQAIAQDPKIMAILQDKEFIKQLLALNKLTKK